MKPNRRNLWQNYRGPFKRVYKRGLFSKDVITIEEEIVKVLVNEGKNNPTPVPFPQMLKRDMDLLEAWLGGRETMLKDAELGDSIEAVEELLRRHGDFEKTVYAQEDKFNAIKRMTLVRDLLLTVKSVPEIVSYTSNCS